MILRRAKPQDMPKVVELLEKRGIAPDFENTLSNVVVEVDGRIIGFASLKVNVEAVVALDPDASIRNKHFAMQEIIASGIKATKENNFDMMHVFVKDESFGQILQDHFGFQTCSGKYLFKGV